MEIKEYRTIEEKVIADWQSLWDKSEFATPVNSPYWFLGAMDAFSYKEFAIFAVYKENILVAIASFIKKVKYGIKVYMVVPENFGCGLPLLVNLEDKDTLKTLIDKISQTGNIYLENIDEYAVNKLKEQRQPQRTIKTSYNYYLRIAKQEDGQVIIRRKKRLPNSSEEIKDKLNLKVFFGVNQQALQTVFEIDNKSRKQIKRYNAFSDRTIQKFYKSLALKFNENFLIHILYYDKKAVCYSIGFIARNSFYGSQNASIKEYDIYSVNHVLFIKIIEFLGKENIEKFDFGSGESVFKRYFTKDRNILYTVILAKNPFIRFYLAGIIKLRKIIYDKAMKHKGIYSTYRRLKKYG